MDLRRVFDCMISVSELGRGQASKVIQSVEDEGNPYIVVKNNKPQAVIISINEYTELMRIKDTFTSLQAANLNPAAFSPVNQPVNHHFDTFEPNLYAESSFTQTKPGSLSEDEINIFFPDEEND